MRLPYQEEDIEIIVVEGQEGDLRAIVFARIPYGPYSSATCRIRVSTPAFAEAACACKRVAIEYHDANSKVIQ